MIFRILKDRDFFETNPEAELVEQFSCLTSDEMKYISLVYDIDSPFKGLSLNERKDTILNLLGYEKGSRGWPAKIKKMIEGADIRYPNAAHYYRSLCPDPDKDTLQAYEAQLDESQKFLMRKNKKPSEMKTAMDMHKKMEELRESIKKLKEEISIREERNEYAIAEEGMASSLSLVEELNSMDYEGGK